MFRMQCVKLSERKAIIEAVSLRVSVCVSCAKTPFAALEGICHNIALPIFQVLLLRQVV